MDHHCVFAANCIGAGNHKQLLLLVIYAAACAAHAIFLYSRLLSRRPPVVAAASTVFCWLCGLLAQQVYGIGVDAGTVDRLQAAKSEEHHRLAERVGAPHAAAAKARLPTAALACAAPSFPDKNRGVGLGALLRLDATAAAAAPAAAWKERADFADGRPGATSTVTITAKDFSEAAGLRRDLFCRAAVDGDGASGAIVRGASFCRGLWSSLREEILGEGPWLLWLVPTPARLSPEAEARVYARE